MFLQRFSIAEISGTFCSELVTKRLRVHMCKARQMILLTISYCSNYIICIISNYTAHLLCDIPLIRYNNKCGTNILSSVWFFNLSDFQTTDFNSQSSVRKWQVTATYLSVAREDHMSVVIEQYSILLSWYCNCSIAPWYKMGKWSLIMVRWLGGIYLGSITLRKSWNP